ncbi:Cobalt ABC transporter, inner membrane subunit CbiQ [Rhodococcus sp. AW25M09]|nr:Cobalt ABC transporter, inner membrane subunit CbiQ [Rhodococcus sp. AW25M09]
MSVDNAAWSSAWRDRAVSDKALLSLGLVICALLLPVWPGSVIVTAVALGCSIFGARTPVRLLFGALRAPAVFVALGAVSIAVTVTTEPHFALGVGQAGLVRAGEVTLHAVAGTTSVLLLAMSTPMVDILDGLRRWRVPSVCVDIAALMYRMLFILLDSVGTIRQSQAARLGYSSPRRAMASTGSLTASVLLKSWDRAYRLDAGLAGREFGTETRTLRTDRPSSRWFVLVSLVGFVAIVALSTAPIGRELL